MAIDASLQAFGREVNKPDHEISLARAALSMAAFEYPGLDVADYVRRLDALAEQAQAAQDDADIDTGDPSAVAVAVAEFLFDRMGFSGNTHNYSDPRNSFLNEVLDRRLGIPITLSVLYLEVAERLSIQAQGVGLPGHFIVRATGAESSTAAPIYLDPFHQGAVLTEEDCRERVRVITNDKLPFNATFLNPVSKRYILTRMLNNLKTNYGSSQDLERARQVIERLLILNPNDLVELRNLGLLYGNSGQRRKAIEILERYLANAPDSPDRSAIERHVENLGDSLSRLN